MKEIVVSVDLPAGEKMEIKKNRLLPLDYEAKKKVPRACIVTGIHGDELEGQYVCYQLVKRIKENRHLLKGIVDVYPALNPLGVDSISRGVPTFDLDMNRIFPGNPDGHVIEYVAQKIVDDIVGSDMCIDVHSSNIFLREIPQVRINEISAQQLIPYARMLNIDFIWVHSSATVLESTLAYSLNARNVPTLVVEMGVGMRITYDYCNSLVEGIFNLLREMQIWTGVTKKIKEPIVSVDGKVSFLNAEKSGIFVPRARHGENIEQGEVIGKILNPLTGEIEQRIIAPCDGLIFTLREYPVVYPGSLLARVLGGEEK